jgi:hypothetical protein
MLRAIKRNFQNGQSCKDVIQSLQDIAQNPCQGFSICPGLIPPNALLFIAGSGQLIAYLHPWE